MATRTRSKSSSAEKRLNTGDDDDVISLATVKELIKAQEEKMKSFLNTFIENTSKRINKLTEDVKGVIDSLEFTQSEVKDLKREVRQLVETANSYRKDEELKITSYDKRVKETDERVKNLEAKTDDLENRIKKMQSVFQWSD